MQRQDHGHERCREKDPFARVLSFYRSLHIWRLWSHEGPLTPVCQQTDAPAGAPWSPKRCCSTWCSSARTGASPKRRWCGSSSSCATKCARTPSHTVHALVCPHRQTTCDACFPQDTGASSLASSNASAAAAPADQRASIHADIERQRQEKLTAKQKDGAGSDPRQAWGAPSPSPSPAPPDAASMPPGTREASTIARSYCSAVGAQNRDARSVFDAYDTSRSGVITFEDLRRGVRNDPSMSKSGLTDTDVRPPTYPSDCGCARFSWSVQCTKTCM